MSDGVLSLKKEKKVEASQKVEGFISKNRKLILTLALLVIIGAAACTAVIAEKNKAKNSHLAALDQIEFTYTNKSEALSEEELETRRADALLALDAEKAESGVAGVRANLLAASINYEKGNFEEAASLYEKAALADEKAYTAGIAFFNAASSYEEAGNKEKARELYLKASEVPSFVEEARAVFNYARLSEEFSLIDDAKASYQKLVDTYTNSTWANLSQARLIKLEAEGK